jgi:hypothetical protein
MVQTVRPPAAFLLLTLRIAGETGVVSFGTLNSTNQVRFPEPPIFLYSESPGYYPDLLNGHSHPSHINTAGPRVLSPSRESRLGSTQDTTLIFASAKSLENACHPLKATGSPVNARRLAVAPGCSCQAQRDTDVNRFVLCNGRLGFKPRCLHGYMPTRQSPGRTRGASRSPHGNRPI